MHDLVTRIRDRLAWLLGLRRDAMAERYDEEARHHLEMLVERNRAAGMAEAEAQRVARLAFGGTDRFKEAARDEARSLAIEELQGDVRFSLRSLSRAPAFATATILTLALGIGATTVIFSVTDHVVLRPLAYRDAERLVLVREIIEEMRDGIPSLGANAGHFIAFRERCAACAEMGALLPLELTLTGAGDPQRVPLARASATLLPMLGARAQLGRLFTEAEDVEGAARVAVLTDGFWRRQFGGRRDIVGQTISLGGLPATVIGVLDPDFALPPARALGHPTELSGAIDALLPLALTRFERDSPGAFNYVVIARLAEGATLERARAELEAVAADFTARNQASMTFHALVVPLQEHIVGGSARALILLLAAVVGLLAIVCVNLANLLLARNAVRMQEAAVRTALGAGRARLVRQALTESVVLALIGGALGLLLSRWGLAALLHFAPATLPRVNEITLDARVLLVTLLVSLAAGMVFGVLPALRFGRSDPAEVLRGQGGRTTTDSRGALRLREVLVAAQVGLSALLLVVTGLLLASFIRVLRVDTGFVAERALAVDVSLPHLRYDSRERRTQFYERALERLDALPGVSAAAVTTALPLEGDVQLDLLALENDPRPPGALPRASIRYVSPSYFAALGTALRAGRAFGSHDRSRPVVVLSRRAAESLWPQQSALGKRLRPGSNDTVAQVVGVVDDVRTASMEQEGTAIAYLPFWQNPPAAATLLLRTADDPEALTAPVRDELRELAPTVPVSRVRTFADVVAAAVAERRFQLFVLTLFAALALAIASVGIYGVVVQSLRRRTGEIGVRMALGARPGDVHRLVLREGLAPVLVGLAGGLLGAVAVGGTVHALLFDVAPYDPMTLVSVTVLLTLVAVIACWIPARRATRMDVVRALRQD